MAESIFMKVSEVAKELGVSESYAYKLVRKLNKELEETGCIVIAGRIDRKFFHEKLYGTRNQNYLSQDHPQSDECNFQPCRPLLRSANQPGSESWQHG